MGNSQNKTQQNTEFIEEEDQCGIIDLDELVEQWIWQTYSKTKLLSRYKREDLLIKVNWKNVSFTQNDVYFYNSTSSCFPRTLFQTNFDNNTSIEQSYNLTTNRTTCSTLKILFTQSLSMSQESTITLQLPKQMISLQNSIQCEQVISFGKDMIKEDDIPWNVNSQLRVPSRTRLLANLNVDEEEFSSSFSTSIRISGRIIASIATHQSPNICLKFIVGDIVDIISKVRKTHHRLNHFEIINENLPSIAFTIHGKCSFRHGVKQYIVLSQESLELSSTSCSDFGNTPSAPSEYCHLTSSYMKTVDLIHSNAKNNERL
ncbi:hypothetical protein I4U23_023891 [Adineta vaga]|nr:hypothetical protein I4U23_023891 [Adineta vaga]